MKNKGIKITVGVILGLLSLSTTAFAGYKVMNREPKKTEVLSESTMVPETIEKIETINQIEIIKPKVTTTIVTANSNRVVTTNSVLTPKASSTSNPARFTDDEDDDVEFEDNEDEDREDDKDDEDEKENHTSPSPSPTASPIVVN